MEDIDRPSSYNEDQVLEHLDSSDVFTIKAKHHSFVTEKAVLVPESHLIIVRERCAEVATSNGIFDRLAIVKIKTSQGYQPLF